MKALALTFSTPVELVTLNLKTPGCVSEGSEVARTLLGQK